MTRLLLAGFGQCARAVFDLASTKALYRTVMVTTRDAGKAFDIRRISPEVEVVVLPGGWQDNVSIVSSLQSNDHVVVSFPPDGTTDSLLAHNLSTSAKIVYVSSTAVYGATTGIINEQTPPAPDADNEMRIAAESVWLEKGARIVRAPGIYRGCGHMLSALRSGRYKIPGDGLNYVSRVHVSDLAQVILAALERGRDGAIYLAADARPATHQEVVRWLCEKYSLDWPQSMPIEEAHRTLRGNRQIISTASLSELEVELKFPDFSAGYENE